MALPTLLTATSIASSNVHVRGIDLDRWLGVRLRRRWGVLRNLNSHRLGILSQESQTILRMRHRGKAEQADHQKAIRSKRHSLSF